MGGHVLVENNYFENALNPIFSQSSILGQWDLRNNNARSSADNSRFNITWTACSGSTPCQKATNWTSTATFPIALPYSYTTYAPEVSRCIALNAAGAGKGLKEAVDVLGSCGGTNNLTISPTAMSFGAAATSQPVAVTANVNWTVTDDQSWLTTSPTSGSNNGSVAVNASANTGAARNGTVTIAGSGITRTVAVTQAGSGTTSSVYQAESGTVGGGTVFESSNGGFNGTGYVNSSANGGFAQLTNIDGRGGGSKTLRIRFALGVSAARTGRLVVNGTASNITFNGTGSWTTWSLQNVSVTLNNNTTNTIRFETTGQDLANIDQVEVL
jgi:Viral BACON domain